MSDAPKRITPNLDPKPLTRSERAVLHHIAMYCDESQHLVQSTRYIADATFLSRKAVQDAITRLNELQLIRTLAGSVNRTSEHIFLKDASGLTNPGEKPPRLGPASGRSPRVRIKAAGGAR